LSIAMASRRHHDGITTASHNRRSCGASSRHFPVRTCPCTCLPPCLPLHYTCTSSPLPARLVTSIIPWLSSRDATAGKYRPGTIVTNPFSAFASSPWIRIPGRRRSRSDNVNRHVIAPGKRACSTATGGLRVGGWSWASPAGAGFGWNGGVSGSKRFQRGSQAGSG
jgi:hypothetical protein